jgi:hypothetical protein
LTVMRRPMAALLSIKILALGLLGGANQ